ncbi:hypothetical protein [Nocardia australiensis]|uniref:hypothetical protein n=1 Tax=Nocardia australiensis TaxID=2887191 RepID=UPI001D13C516|nr:hypothetical protein [Nocardia australiensis]
MVVLLIGAAIVVAADHGHALRRLGLSRTDFVLDVLALFRAIAPAAIPGNHRTGRPAVFGDPTWHDDKKSIGIEG